LPPPRGGVLNVTPEQRIEEAHGLWELAVARVAAIAEVAVALGFPPALIPSLADATLRERETFLNWRAVSKECGA